MPSVQYCSQVMVTSAWWLGGWVAGMCKEPGIVGPVDKRASGISDKWNISHVPW